VLWPALAGALLLGARGLTLLARRWNRNDQATGFYLALLAAITLEVIGGAALLADPWLTGLDPTSHVYPATVWLLVIWTIFHLIVGIVMQLYCLARRMAGRMNASHDIEIVNVTLYWHFIALTAFITVAVIAGFPLVV
jgi:cytochrome c oxidase subunit I+III